jgi:hypothetical protein
VSLSPRSARLSRRDLRATPMATSRFTERFSTSLPQCCSLSLAMREEVLCVWSFRQHSPRKDWRCPLKFSKPGADISKRIAAPRGLASTSSASVGGAPVIRAKSSAVTCRGAWACVTLVRARTLGALGEDTPAPSAHPPASGPPPGAPAGSQNRFD